MTRVLCCIGTRPEAIKLAPVVLELRRRPDRFAVTVCWTGQHREMVPQVLADFGLDPEIRLDTMHPGQSLASLTASLLTAVDGVVATDPPDWILVQGDTTTAMAAGLCGFYRGIRCAHVEAGLRSFNRFAPFPEEINRRIVGAVADLHFAPTLDARSNLLAERVDPQTIVVTGNTVIDALLQMVEIVRRDPPALPEGVEALMREKRRVILVTGHRRESFGAEFRNICTAILEAAARFPDAAFVYPVHLNPNVQAPVREILGHAPGVCLTGPLAYGPFVRLMDASLFILTDSGGIQEEAPSLGKPVLVMRDVTERPEGVAAGVSRLVGTRRESILEAVSGLLADPAALARMRASRSPYGDGHAAVRIADALEARSDLY